MFPWIQWTQKQNKKEGCGMYADCSSCSVAVKASGSVIIGWAIWFENSTSELCTVGLVSCAIALGVAPESYVIVSGCGFWQQLSWVASLNLRLVFVTVLAGQNRQSVRTLKTLYRSHVHVINLPVCVDIAHRLSLVASNLFTLLVHCSDGYLAWLYLYKDKYALRNCMKCIPTKRVYIT